MNYVELHIGDYDKATAHLTACEDGMYGRLLRKYYDTEAPLPLNLKALQRLVRARTREEREAVVTILGEFFIEQADGWHHGRCDEEIAKYRAKSEKARRSAQARWDAPNNGSERNSNASPNAMRTHSEGNAHQTPDTSHQSPVSPATDDSTAGTKGLDTLRASARATPTEVGRACLLMRQAGLTTTSPQDPRLLAAFEAGGTPEMAAHAATLAVAKGKGFAYALGVLNGLIEDASKPRGGRANPEAIHERNRAIGAAWAADRAQEDPDETR